MKSLTKSTLLIATILSLGALTLAVNVTWGTLGPYDRLVARDNVYHSANFFSKHKEVLEYPPKGHQSFLTLTAIRLFDWGGRKNFGYATLLSGGPGFNTASIEFKSQSRKPLNFTVEYFTRN